jgi:hypothetical protein
MRVSPICGEPLEKMDHNVVLANLKAITYVSGRAYVALSKGDTASYLNDLASTAGRAPGPRRRLLAFRRARPQVELVAVDLRAEGFAEELSETQQMWLRRKRIGHAFEVRPL